MYCRYWIDTRKKWYKWVHKRMIKRFSNFMIIRVHVAMISFRMCWFTCITIQAHNFVFDIAGLTGHTIQLHTDIREFECKTCDKKFGLKAYLNMHIQEVHIKKTLAVCDKCSKIFTSIPKFRAHYKNTHKINLASKRLKWNLNRWASTKKCQQTLSFTIDIVFLADSKTTAAKRTPSFVSIIYLVLSSFESLFLGFLKEDLFYFL